MGAGAHPQGRALCDGTDEGERRSLAAAARHFQTGHAHCAGQGLRRRRRTELPRLQEVPHLGADCRHGRSERREVDRVKLLTAKIAKPLTAKIAKNGREEGKENLLERWALPTS